jgi:hypothetical protein
LGREKEEDEEYNTGGCRRRLGKFGIESARDQKQKGGRLWAKSKMVA